MREAAIHVFGILGDTLSMDDVAREAGVSKGTIYGTYPTRERLLEDMTVYVLEGSRNAMRTAAAASDPWQGLVEAVVTKTLGVAYRAEISDPDAPRSKARTAAMEAEKALNELLDILKAKGIVRPEIDAHHLSVLFRGLYFALPPYAQRASAEVSEYAHIILRGIRTTRD